MNINPPEPSINEKINHDFTLLLPVRNEIKNIEKKIIELISLFGENAKKLIIIDSNSVDSTAEKAEILLDNLETNFECEVIKTKIIGKSNSINEAIDKIQTSWFIMFDADAFINDKTIKYLLRWMQDSSCGAVCGAKSNSSGDISYRRRFNKIRTAESSQDSSTILEGSFCAIRMEALKGIKLNGKINADDTQFALMVKRNGYRAIFESRAEFSDSESSNYFLRLKRNIRRSQGLIRVFWANKDLINRNTKFGISYLHSLYFYIIFPWLFTLSSFLILSDIFSSEYSFIFFNWYIFIPLFLIIIIFKSSILTFFNGIFSLIIAQLSIILGLKFHLWNPSR